MISAKDDVDGCVELTASYFKNADNTEIEARNRLMERSFIIRVGKQRNVSGEDILEIHDLPYLKLTALGKDTALLYRNWFRRFGLWCADFKKPWIITVITFFLGIAATILSQILGQMICKYFGLGQ